MPESQKFQRQVAYKLRIADILEGQFAKDDISAGYIKLNDVAVSRVNIIGTVVYKYEQTSGYNSAVIDDGTGRISLRSFDNANIFSKLEIGDAALVIGKVREFNNEKYIIPEILKKIDNVGWLNVRKLELKNTSQIENNNIKSIKNEEKEFIEENNNGISDEIYSLIKKLDNGDGVSIGDLIKTSKSNNAEIAINKLLKNGDVFEIKPGKLKVLE